MPLTAVSNNEKFEEMVVVASSGLSHLWNERKFIMTFEQVDIKENIYKRSKIAVT